MVVETGFLLISSKDDQIMKLDVTNEATIAKTQKNLDSGILELLGLRWAKPWAEVLSRYEPTCSSMAVLTLHVTFP